MSDHDFDTSGICKRCHCGGGPPPGPCGEVYMGPPLEGKVTIETHHPLTVGRMVPLETPEDVITIDNPKVFPGPPPGKVMTTTLLGPRTAKIALRAIESARALGIRDHLIIPWNLEDPIDVEDQCSHALLREDMFTWAAPFTGTGFAAARNYALDQAERMGAEWAITLDTDERLHGSLPVFARAMSGRTFTVRNPDDGYTKQRIFQLPARGRWVGVTHETYIPGLGEESLDVSSLTFSELPKTPEQIKAKAERDVALLVPEFAKTNDPRWAFYLGESYALLAACAPVDASPFSLAMGGRNHYLDKALQAYRNCARLRDTPTWDNFREEGGWAMFKAARLLSEYTPAGRFQGTDVLDLLIEGMRVCPWMAELPYLAAHLETRDPKRRLAWARMAISLGRVEGIDIPRVSWFEGKALYEAPYDLAEIAYKEMGDEARASQMWDHAQVAKSFREKRGE